MHHLVGHRAEQQAIDASQAPAADDDGCGMKPHGPFDDAFSRIARAVEISLFGGRSIDAGAWEQCRGAYAELTVPKNWARA